MNIGTPPNITFGTDPTLGDMVIEMGQILSPLPKVPITPTISDPKLDLILTLLRDIHYRVCTPWYIRLYKWVKRLCGTA
jgi:hypothetical protein